MAGATRRCCMSRASFARYTGSSTIASAAAVTSTLTLLGTPLGRQGPPRIKPEMLRATVLLDFFFRVFNRWEFRTDEEDRSSSCERCSKALRNVAVAGNHSDGPPGRPEASAAPALA